GHGAVGQHLNQQFDTHASARRHRSLPVLGAQLDDQIVEVAGKLVTMGFSQRLLVLHIVRKQIGQRCSLLIFGSLASGLLRLAFGVLGSFLFRGLGSSSLLLGLFRRFLLGVLGGFLQIGRASCRERV